MYIKTKNNAEEGAIDSPCIRNCCLNEEDICLGCFRSMQEICRWHSANRDEQKAILSCAAQRKAKYTSKRT